jgi:cytochrome c-type biogenesis protein CcmF
MLAEFGFSALLIALLVTVYGSGAAVFGVRKNKPAWVESARLSMLLSFPLITLSVLSLVYYLVTGGFNLEYVSSVTSNSMPLYLRFAALWGGQSGSLLFWSWLMAAFAALVAFRNWDRDREFLPWVIVVFSITLAFFLVLIVFFENPFNRVWSLPGGDYVVSFFRPLGASAVKFRDGQGLNPLLRHPGMVVHPPMLYLGFVSFVVPYAFAMAALITGRTDDRWIRITRRWTLFAWLFLSLGLILGARWAYDVLGWGGYWAWDPVEIAAFMPWLTGTAFLHSVMIQEKRGMVKRWNIVLVILTYCLVIFGTFLTRSGVLSSVHAFAQSAIGPMFFLFIGVVFIISLYLLMHRWDDLRSEAQMTSMLSRETLFLVNNLFFLSILVVCFWGVIFPVISEVITGQKVTVGPPFYERATAPLFAGLMFLMGIAPLSAWRSSTTRTIGNSLWKPFVASLIAGVLMPFILGIRQPVALFGFWLVALVILVTFQEFWRGALARHRKSGESLPQALCRLAGRNRRRYGGYIVHLGCMMMALGVIGIEIFQNETQGNIPLGGTLSLGDYRITYRSLAVFDTQDGRNVARAVLSLERKGRNLGELYPRRDYYYESQQPMTIPGVRSTLADDLYVILVDWLPVSTQGATFKIYHNPLVNWLWLGGLVFILGTMVAAWPEKIQDKRPIEASNPLFAKRGV